MGFVGSAPSYSTPRVWHGSTLSGFRIWWVLAKELNLSQHPTVNCSMLEHG